jgi:tRNA pseudouridine55 synthase
MSRRARGKRKERPGPSGFIVVDKPSEWTSHDVVAKARGWFGTSRVGHLGTLDPLATGVLPLAIRDATKLIPFLEKARKRYTSTFLLGVETNSYDSDGQETRRFEGELPSADEIDTTLKQFEGEIEQLPPMFSAVKIGGVPLYKLARKGEEIERELRRVQVESFVLHHWAAPRAEIEVACSSGTYVRTLAFDMGRALGCGAHVESMRRTESSPFAIEEALTLKQIGEAFEGGCVDSLVIPPEEPLGLPLIQLSVPQLDRVMNGCEIPATDPTSVPGARFAALTPKGRLCAVLEMRPNRQLAPMRVFPPLAS